MANDIKQQEVVAQKNKLVGDDEVEVREAQAEVNTNAVKAQVAPARESEPKQVPVHETRVTTDEVVTDPSSPEAVQVPDAGRGSLDVPIHRLGAGTVEEKFAEADDSEDDESSDDSASTSS